MRYAFVDFRISKAIKNALSSFADNIISLPPLLALPAPVASHPDMLIWCYGKTIVTWSAYKAQNADIFTELERAGFEILTSNETPSDKYPLDVPLNVATVGANIIANTRAVSQKIKEIAADRGLSLLHTNQGYAKCSTCIVSERAIITADASIHALAEKNGISSLLVSTDGVALDGYDKGFIGGASGSDGTSLFFCGDLSNHPDGKRIAAFCAEHGKKAVSLSNEPLYDYGTVLFLDI